MSYQIVDIVTGKVMESGFKTRQSAKEKRDALNAEVFNERQMSVLITSDITPRFVVSRSPTHSRGESCGLEQRAARALTRNWPAKKAQ